MRCRRTCAGIQSLGARALIPWDLLSTAIRWLDHRSGDFHVEPTLKNRTVPANNFTVIVVDGAEFPMGLHSMLIECDILEASNPWDRLYALLGLITRGPALGPRPVIIAVYTKPLKDVYAHATRLAIQESRDLYLLGYMAPDLTEADDAISDDSDWPSWVPRYHQNMEQDVWVTNSSESASSSELVEAKLMRDTGEPDNDVLTLHGVTFDVIDSIAFPLGPMVSDQNGLPRFPWSLLVWKIAPNASERSIWSIAEALVGGYHGVNRTAVDQADLNADFAASMRRVHGLSIPTNSVLEGLLNATSTTYGDADRYQGEIIQIARNSLARMRNGKYCIVQRAVAAGDAVCVLFGGQVPFVMRQGSESIWRLRGVAYVPGIMQGEYIDELDGQGRLQAETSTFDIR
ncbi:unnamed protein product [Zymoseptoria tritici ST99CH_3D7]|uniref:Heterokaryon incompatibility domain-containing protein n=1 Tax=Zymoseptoria tritici (strain ST99CH_3D7) TaxID=1276538 RepID=A0A1X7RL82_ZYMT9|nr:unnamed protein product [Zymoseptoria tritici ST99CH_3D7]